MMITIKDNKIIYTLENPNLDFIKAIFGGIDYENALSLTVCVIDDSDERITRLNYKYLDCVLAWAKIYKIEVKDEVLQLKEKWENDIAEFDRKEGEINAKWLAKEKWQRLKKYGCLICENRLFSKTYDDTFYCKATKKLLHTKNIGLNDKDNAEVGKFYGINAIFCFAPFPAEDCPFKTDELDENDSEYIKWKNDIDNIF